MGLPKSVIKIKKDGVEFKDSVDRTMYFLEELQRAALRDSAKIIRKRMAKKLRALPGMKKNKRIYNSTQYWVRKRETDLQIGFKHDTWYGVQQEIGSHNQPKRAIVKNSVMKNIAEIRKIEGQYLSAIENENKAIGLIDPDDEGGKQE